VSVGVSVGVRVGVLDGVEVIVPVDVTVTVPEGFSDRRPVGLPVTVSLGATRTIRIDLVTVAVAIEVGEAVGEIAVTGIGDGMKISPRTPIRSSTNPLAELRINDLGYSIRLQESFYNTINQFAIQVEIIIGSLAMMGTDHDFVRLVVQIIDRINCKIRAIGVSTETDPLIGDEKKAGILGIKPFFALVRPMHSQPDGRNGQDYVFSLAKRQITGIFEEIGVDIRDIIQYART
jgi:hypothetical protein